MPNKPSNKKITFTYSDSDEEDDDDQKDNEDEDNPASDGNGTANNEGLSYNREGVCSEKQIEDISKDGNKDEERQGNQEVEDEGKPAKKQCLEADPTKDEKIINDKADELSADKLIEKQCVEADPTKDEKIVNGKADESIDKLIDAELEELKDKSKVSLQHPARFKFLNLLVITCCSFTIAKYICS